MSGVLESPRLTAQFQNKAIREAAGVFLRNLRSIPKHGDQLTAIVTAFGNVAHSYLMHRNCKNITGKPPWQATRIEPYEPLALDAKAQRLYDELLRYSVFIEDVRGKSRRGKVVPRLYLRRFLIPHFSLTFSMRDPLELEPSEVEQLLLEPARFEDRMRLRCCEPESESRNEADAQDGDAAKLQGDLPLDLEGKGD